MVRLETKHTQIIRDRAGFNLKLAGVAGIITFLGRLAGCIIKELLFIGNLKGTQAPMACAVRGGPDRSATNRPLLLALALLRFVFFQVMI